MSLFEDTGGHFLSSEDISEVERVFREWMQNVISDYALTSRYFRSKVRIRVITIQVSVCVLVYRSKGEPIYQSSLHLMWTSGGTCIGLCWRPHHSLVLLLTDCSSD